jgi:hypothetical protein
MATSTDSTNTDITVKDLTDGVLTYTHDWEGNGIFDKLISAVNKNIEGQFNKGRITTTDYANVYLGALQTVIAQSIQFLLQEKVTEKEVDVKVKQIELIAEQKISEATNRYNNGIKLLEEAVTKYGYTNCNIDADGKLALGSINESKGLINHQTKTAEAQTLLYGRQKTAFDDNKNQKLLESQLNYHSMVFAEADNPTVLDIASNTKVNTTYAKLV